MVRLHSEAILLWNFWLAFVPLGIAWLIAKLKDGNSLKWVLGGFWLLFLPNSGYMLTDVIHFGESPYVGSILGLVVAIFMALIFMCQSIDIVEGVLARVLPQYIRYTRTAIFALNGYGIYLGRCLRLNSWEIITDPEKIIMTMAENVSLPAVVFTSAVSVVTWIIYKTYHSLLPLCKSSLQ